MLYLFVGKTEDGVHIGDESLYVLTKGMRLLSGNFVIFWNSAMV